MPKTGSILRPLVSLLIAGPCVAQPGDCRFAYAPRPATPAFRDYPAAKLGSRLKAPDIKAGEARRHRTEIRHGAAVGVNFAGRYTVVGWGCGSACIEWALIDRLTGAVRFDPDYRVVATANVRADPERAGDDVDRTFSGLRFRPDSSLLVVQGTPNGDERRDGLSFLHWTGREFQRIAFIPANKLCTR